LREHCYLDTPRSVPFRHLLGPELVGKVVIIVMYR